MGGNTEFMKVAAMAQAHDIQVAPHGKQDVHIHLVSAIPNGLTVEYYRPRPPFAIVRATPVRATRPAE